MYNDTYGRKEYGRVKDMSVEFNEPEIEVRRSAGKQKISLGEIVQNAGLAKDEKGAQVVLAVLAVLILLAAALLFLFVLPASTPAETVPLPPERP